MSWRAALPAIRGGTVNETKPQSVPSRRRARRAVVLLALATGPLALMAACRPGPGPSPSPSTTKPRPSTTRPDPTTTKPNPPRCRTIDFEKANVTQVPSTATVPRWKLTVTGTKPSISMSVSLEPLTYIRQPEYWGIEVQGCDPPEAGLPATGPYTVTLDLTGVLGINGIEVIGATTRQRIDIAEDAPASKLPGTSWVLDPASLGVAVPAGVAVTATFGTNNIVSGRAACNQYNAGYKANGTALVIASIATTRMACEPAVMTAESAYLRKLAGVTSYSLSSSGLILSGSAGELRFHNAAG
jgi:heat shock protein HslJ